MRYLDWTYPDLASNLALDEALLVRADESGSGPILRFWELDHEAVVLGASCKLLENLQIERCVADGVSVGRRSSGGGTVLIGPGALNFTVVLPVDFDPALKAVDTAQAFVLGRVAEELAKSVEGVVLRGSGDLTRGGRKFSGSAQRRLRQSVMIHATILRDFPLDRIGELLRMPPRQPAYREGRPHSDFLTNLGIGNAELKTAIRRAWASDDPIAPGIAIPEGLVGELCLEKFSNPTWINRL